METGTCTTCYSDEQHREQGLSCLGLPAGESWNIESNSTGESTCNHTDECQTDHSVQQEAGQIVTGLQKDPYGNQGSYSDVHTYEYDPCDTVHCKTNVQAKNSDQYDTDDATDGSGQSLDTHSVGHITINNSQNDK